MKKLPILSLFLALCPALSAAVIVSVTGAVGGGLAAGQQQAVTAGFTLGQNYTGVAISAVIGGITTQNVTAYLTTQIGAGTTPGSHEVASVTLALPGPGAQLTQIFSGLSLPAGSYFLTLYHPIDTGASWYRSDAATIDTALGSSHDFDGYYITNFPMVALPDYAPAATFVDLDSVDPSDLLYLVETADVPEPATLMLTGAALLGIAAWRRARRRD